MNGNIASNYVEGGGAGDRATLITHANHALNSTVKYFVESIGGNTYVCANDGHGNVGMSMELVEVGTGAISDTNIIA